MLFQSRRLIADLRRVAGLLFGIGLTTFIISVVATYMAFFSLAEARTGVLSTSAPEEPLGFIRVLDPNESIVTRAESPEDLDRSVLEEPGLHVLLERMVGDSRMFVVLPLSAFLLDWRSSISVDTDARAVMGSGPPFISEIPKAGEVLTWGSIGSEESAIADLLDDSLPEYGIRRVSEQPLRAWFVAGSGHRTPTGGSGLVVFDIAAGRSLGVSSPYSVSEVLQGFTCSCQSDELVSLTEAMSRAEEEAGTGRIFYSIDYEGLIGPVQRSRALASSLNTGHVIGTLLAVWCLVVMVAQILWTRRARVYQVERIAGSNELPMHIRSQTLVGLALTFPALAGFALVNAAIRGSTWPPPLPTRAVLIAIGGILVMHTLAGGINAARIHRLCSFGREEARNV